MARKRARQAVEAEPEEGVPPIPAAAAAASPVNEDVEVRSEPDRRAEMANLARRRAAHFAHFAGDDQGNSAAANVHVGSNEARTLGPWSSAMALVNARDKALEEREENMLLAQQEKAKDEEGLQWDSQRDVSLGARHSCPVATLFDTCVSLITELVDCVDSLDGVPDVVRVKMAANVCRRRKLSPQVALMFAGGAPGEVVLPDCTQVDAQTMIELARQCATPRLERLDLTSCGRGFGDEAAAALAKGGPLPLLRSVELRGAYRLSDVGLEQVLRAAPNLVALSIPQASRITAASLQTLPTLVPHLRRLDLQDCRGVDGETLLAVLPQLPALSALVLDGIAEVDDKVLGTIAGMADLRHLSLCYCQNITDDGLADFARASPRLESLKLDECAKLTDASLFALASSCKELQVLSLRRCTRFSDKSLALLVAHGSLHRLVVNGVPEMGKLTMRALATHCKHLEALDISFCRHVHDKALGLVADSCKQLQELTVFGCSQVSKLFLHGHSNDRLTSVAGVGTACF